MKFLSLFFLLLCIGLIGCTAQAPTPSVAMIETAIAQTQQANPPTPTTQPAIPISSASSPKPANLPAPTPTISLIATVIAEPIPVFENAHILGMGHLQTGYLLITIEVSGEINGSYQALVENESFNCQVLLEYPNRLYCTGQTSHQGKFVHISVIESRSQKPVFETEAGIPPSPYTAQFVEVKRDNSLDSDPAQPAPTAIPTTPAYPYP